MMQKVRDLISAFMGLTELFHFSFSVPLRYFFCHSWCPFLSPILRGENGLFMVLFRSFGVIYMGLLFLGFGLAVWHKSNSICTNAFSV